MKKGIVSLIVVLASVTAFAGPARIESLECKGTNGVLIKTQEITRDGSLLIRSQWGGYTRSFIAKLAQVTEDHKAMIVLAEQVSAPDYAIELAVNPSLTAHQVVAGWILRPNPYSGGSPLPVTPVRCELRFARQSI